MSTLTPQDTPLSPPLASVVETESTGGNAVQPTAEVVDGTAQPEAPEAQGDDRDYDSAFGSDGASTTDSITSSIRHYREMHGRTYHNYSNTEYWGPNDEQANEQLDIGHHMYNLMLDNKLYLAPIDKNVQRVLDIGTGTGIWAIDFADQHPSASVIGTDLSPIQPGWVPPNLKFEIDDAQLEWTYPPNTFDFVYVRCMGGSIDNWKLLYSRAFTAIKPGGYFEQFDANIQFASDDGGLKEDDVMLEWSRLFIDAGEKMGRTFKLTIKEHLEEVGFVDVVEKKYKLPIGPWMQDKKWKEIGSWSLLHITSGLESMALYMLTHVHGWDYAEVQVFLARMRKALHDPNRHAYYGMVATYGRKPELV